MKYLSKFKEMFGGKKYKKPLELFHVDEYYKEIKPSDCQGLSKKNVQQRDYLDLKNRLQNLLSVRKFWREDEGFVFNISITSGVISHLWQLRLQFNNYEYVSKRMRWIKNPDIRKGLNLLRHRQYVISIYILDDDYFLIVFINDNQKRFICDQWDGLLKCLEDNNIVSRRK